MLGGILPLTMNLAVRRIKASRLRAGYLWHQRHQQAVERFWKASEDGP